MKELNILICEGNTPEEGKVFQDVGIPTHTESLKESLAYYNKKLNIDVLNPCLELDLNKTIPELKKYDGLIWGGSSLNIYNDTPEIRRQISFMKICFKNIKKILAICWGMQVAVTAAGGEVKKGVKGSHIGIANEIELTDQGISNLFYKDKKNKFNTPAFNFDEVCELPEGATLLASDKVNNIMGVYFKSANSEVWGLQYHPDYEYWQMINLSNERMGKMIAKEYFKNEEAFKKHIDFIKSEEKSLDFENKTYEIQNWLNIIR